MPLIDKNAWLFSAKAFAAAVAALYVAMACGLERPYWAMLTAYIVSQPLVGPTRAKGRYRILGTLIGGIATIAMLPNLVQSPLLLCAAMAIWLSVCLYVALLNRGPNGYMFMLAGYTAVLLAFPAVEEPLAIFDVVVARGEEIILGAAMAIVASALFLPNSVRPTVNTRIGRWMQDAARWYRQIRLAEAQPVSLPKLATDLVQLESLITMMRHEGLRHEEMAQALEKLRERMLLLLPVLAAISDRLIALRAAHAMPADLAPLLEDVDTWLQLHEAADAKTARRLRARAAALRPAGDVTREDLLLASLLVRLDELIALWQDCAGLHKYAVQGDSAPPRRHYRFPFLRLGRERHVDHGMAAMSALSTGVSLFAYCMVWIAVGWQAGGNGAMMAAIASAFFASQDDPAPGIFGFGLWLAVAAAIAAVLLFAIFPMIHEFAMLVAVLGLVFLPVGVLIYSPRTAAIGMPLSANLAALLSVQNSHDYDLTAFVNNAVAMIIGIGFAVVFTRIFRTVSAEWSARRLVRHAWQILADVAAGTGGPADKQRLSGRIMDLLGLLAPRIAITPRGSEVAAVDMLTEARVGMNLMQLRRARAKLPPQALAALDAVLAGIAAHYRQRAGQAPDPGTAAEGGQRVDAALRQHLDRAIAQGHGVTDGAAQDDYLLGLVGLRLILFPREAGTAAATTAAA